MQRQSLGQISTFLFNYSINVSYKEYFFVDVSIAVSLHHQDFQDDTETPNHKCCERSELIFKSIIIFGMKIQIQKIFFRKTRDQGDSYISEVFSFLVCHFDLRNHFPNDKRGQRDQPSREKGPFSFYIYHAPITVLESIIYDVKPVFWNSNFPASLVRCLQAVESFISIKIFSSFPFEAEAEVDVAAMIEAPRPPFRVEAWLRFRDGFEATAVAEATTEAASSFPFKDQRKSYCACYKLYFLLCY